MHKRTIDISVCVPTYKRPRTLDQLIQSFKAQSYIASELLIVDDAQDFETKKVVDRYAKSDTRIRFIQNNTNLGYARNLYKTLTEAHGNYLLIMGDDDLLLGKDTLKRYVIEFKKNPEVGFIYSNILQFNDMLSFDYAYTFFPQYIQFAKGTPSLQNMWLKSTFIGGIGIRNDSSIKTFYPDEKILFPNVELIGNILLISASVGLANYCIGMRAHADQLGVHIAQNERISGNERHAYLELNEIADKIRKNHKTHIKSAESDALSTSVQKFLQEADSSILIAESTRGNKNGILSIMRLAGEHEKRIKHTKFFYIQLVLVSILPQQLLIWIKECMRLLLKILFWHKESVYFEAEKKRIFNNV